MKWFVTGWISLSLMGCAASIPSPNTGPLRPCIEYQALPMGDTNGSLLQAFLSAREGLSLCQGIAQALEDAE